MITTNTRLTQPRRHALQQHQYSIIMIPLRFSFGCPMFDHIRNIANTNTPYKLQDPSTRILHSIQQQWYDSSNITFMLHQQRLDMLILFTTLQCHNGLNLL